MLIRRDLTPIRDFASDDEEGEYERLPPNTVIKEQ